MRLHCNLFCCFLFQVNNGKNGSGAGSKSSVSMSTTTHMLQCPPAQVLVIERMHSGARRFVVLDFGRCVLLTDILIPACTDLASLSIDTWVHGEEVDGKRLLVATDIGIRSLVMNDLMPPPVCRYLKVSEHSGGTNEDFVARSRYLRQG